MIVILTVERGSVTDYATDAPEPIDIRILDLDLDEPRVLTFEAEHIEDAEFYTTLVLAKHFIERGEGTINDSNQ